ncbi:MAG: gliding motility-associated C-terminal domain-containing protein [Luteibaculaceae bacterium]
MHLRYILIILVLLTCSIFQVRANEFFIENKGQLPDSILFSVNLQGGTAYLSKGGVTFVYYDEASLEASIGHSNTVNIEEHAPLKGHSFFLSWLNHTPQTQYSGRLKTKGYHNYFLGDITATKVGLYQEVYAKNLWPNIDVKFTISPLKGLKYEFIVSPGADPSTIKLTYSGLDKLSIKTNGKVELETSVGTLTDAKPISFLAGNKSEIIESAWQLNSDNTLSFILGDYPRDEALVIDPEILFASYTGSSANNFGFSATYDSFGHFYLGGIAFTGLFPTTLGAFMETNPGSVFSVVISKFDPSGTNLLYSTFLGGQSIEIPCSMVTNSLGELYMLGVTSSANFPVSSNAFQTAFLGGASFATLLPGVGTTPAPAGTDYFISKLSTDGSSLLASTFFGGSNNDGAILSSFSPIAPRFGDGSRSSIILDKQENVVITGYTLSNNLPTTQNAFQNQSFANGTLEKAFVSKFNPNLSTLLASTYFTSGIRNNASSVVVNSANEIIIVGTILGGGISFAPQSHKPNFTPSNNEETEAYIAKFNPNLTQLTGGSYFGSTSREFGYLIDIDANDNLYFTGTAMQSQGALNINHTGYSVENGGHYVAKFAPNASTLIFSTEIGVSGQNQVFNPSAFAVDNCENILLSGWGGTNSGSPAIYNTNTNGLPTTPDALQNTTTGGDFWLAMFSPNMETLEYATFLGGDQSDEHVDGGTSRFDKNGIIYQAICAGCQGNSDFPTTPNVVSNTNNSFGCNALALKMQLNSNLLSANFSVEPFLCDSFDIIPQNTSQNFETLQWILEPGNLTSNQSDPVFTVSESGIYTLTLIAQSATTCNSADTLTRTIVVLASENISLSPIEHCGALPISIGPQILFPDSASFLWEPNSVLSDLTVQNPLVDSETNETFILNLTLGTCTTQFSQEVNTLFAGLIPELETQFFCGTGPHSLELPFTNPLANYFWFTEENGIQTSPVLSSNPANFLVQDTVMLVYGFTGGICADTARVLLINRESTLDFNVEPSCYPNPGLVEFFPTDLSNLESITPTQNDFITAISATVFEFNFPESTYQTFTITYNQCIFELELELLVIEVSQETNFIDTIPQEVIPNALITLSVQPIENTSILWQPIEFVTNPNAWETTAFTDKNRWFYATLTKESCSVTDSILISIKQDFCREPFIFLPNAFSPNNDGNNDFLQIFGEPIETLSLQIFNRWGQMVFETTNPRFRWDGTFNGKPLEKGVYVYQLSVDCIPGVNFSKNGNITILR